MKTKITILNLLIVFNLLKAQDTWTQKADFAGVARSGASGFSIGNKGYILLGISSWFNLDFYEWDKATDTWTQKAAFPGNGRFAPVAFSIGNKGYICTGSSDASHQVFYKDFWEWDQVTDMWTRKADFPGEGRWWATSFTIGSKAYIGGGMTFGLLNDFWEWDQLTDTWTRKADFGGTARRSACAFSIGTKGYMGLGEDGSLKNDFWEWDQSSNIWTQKADFGGTARIDASAFSIGTKGYIGLGYDGSSKKKDFWEWDQLTEIWTQKADFGGQARAGAVSFAIGTNGFIGTGNDTKDFWEYDPANIIGINEYDLNRANFIYPCPSDGIFTIILYHGESIVYIKNSLGENIYYSKIDNGKTEIDLSQQPKGIYFLELLGNNIKQTGKIILQ